MAKETAVENLPDVPVVEQGEATVTIPMELDDDLRDALEELRETIDEHESLKEQASAAKKEMENAQIRVNAAAQALSQRRRTRPDGWPADAPLACAADGPGDDEAWREVKLEDLDGPAIKPGVLKVLAENAPPIITMGDLAKWQEVKSDFWARDVDGLGKAGQDQIAAATDAFWEQEAQMKAEAEESEGEDGEK